MATGIRASPVMGASGKPIGVCSVGLKTSVITDEISKCVLGKSGYFAVIDGSGLFVLHPSKDIAMKVNIKDLPGLEAVAKRALAGETGYNPITTRARVKWPA